MKSNSHRLDSGDVTMLIGGLYIYLKLSRMRRYPD